MRVEQRYDREPVPLRFKQIFRNIGVDIALTPLASRQDAATGRVWATIVADFASRSRDAKQNLQVVRILSNLEDRDTIHGMDRCGIVRALLKASAVCLCWAVLPLIAPGRHLRIPLTAAENKQRRRKKLPKAGCRETAIAGGGIAKASATRETTARPGEKSAGIPG